MYKYQKSTNTKTYIDGTVDTIRTLHKLNKDGSLSKRDTAMITQDFARKIPGQPIRFYHNNGCKGGAHRYISSDNSFDLG